MRTLPLATIAFIASVVQAGATDDARLVLFATIHGTVDVTAQGAAFPTAMPAVTRIVGGPYGLDMVACGRDRAEWRKKMPGIVEEAKATATAAAEKQAAAAGIGAVGIVVDARWDLECIPESTAVAMGADPVP